MDIDLDPLNHILLVEDDAALRGALAQTLELAGKRVTIAGSFVAARDYITSAFDGVILSDIRMPGRDGFHLLEFSLTQDPELPVILLTGEGDIPMAVRAMNAGAFGFLEKPCASEDLFSILERALKSRSMVLSHRAAVTRREAGDPAARLIFGVSHASEKLRSQVRNAAQSKSDLYIYGAAGTGIAKVAEVVHLSSASSQGPFEKRASAGLTRSDLEHAFEQAAHGALFLDNISQMPEDTQLALLDHLEEQGRTVRVFAGGEVAAQDVAINMDLKFRLDVVSLRIPSLAERPEDIPVLFRHYVAQAAEQSGHVAPEISRDVLSDLVARDWTGNARALMRYAMRFVLGTEAVNEDSNQDLGLNEQLARLERSLLMSALQTENGRAGEAARRLKLPRKTFYDKLAKHGIRAEDYR